jgi:UPF0176 protein
MKVIAFYSFFKISNPLEAERTILEFFKEINVKGTILIGSEGLNGTIAVPENQENNTINFLITLGVKLENIKVSQFDGKRVFNRFKTKIKKEIVTSDFNLTIEDIHQGKFIEPHQWDAFILQENVEVIDTRNDYEYKIGKFKKAKNPNIQNFRQFKKYIEENKDTLKNKKVAIYCTGGIRCEKAGPLMQKHGIDTYQLKGGILKYFEETPAEQWDGECFVFDYRVSVDKSLNPGKSELCFGCNMPLTEEDRKSPLYEEGFTCPDCHDQLTEKKKQSLTDKREHWKGIL